MCERKGGISRDNEILRQGREKEGYLEAMKYLDGGGGGEEKEKECENCLVFINFSSAQHLHS